MAKKHIFPIILDDAKQTVTGNTSWNGTSSVVSFTASSLFTLGDATIPGTIVCLIGDAASAAITVTVTTPVSSNQATISMVITDAGTSTSLVWTNDGWMILGDVDSTVLV